MIDTTVLARLGDLVQNPEQVTYSQRVGAAGPDGADTFNPFTLYAAQRREATREDLEGAMLSVSDEALVWVLVASDLAQAGAPVPVQSYQLADAAGVTWVVEKVTGRYFNAQYECVCRKAR